MNKFKFNKEKTIKMMDKLAKTENSGITKLPVIPSANGYYEAQYIDNTGLKYNREVVVYRIYPMHVGIYYIDYSTDDNRNCNNRNTTFVPLSNELLLMRIFSVRSKLSFGYNIEINRYVRTIDEIIKRKSNPFNILQQLLTEITGVDCKVANPKDKSKVPYWNTNPPVSNEKALEAAYVLKTYLETAPTYDMLEIDRIY
jgi:hypothetical protein